MFCGIFYEINCLSQVTIFPWHVFLAAGFMSSSTYLPVLFLQIRSETKLLCFILLLRELLDTAVVYAIAILSVPVTLMISI